MTDHDTAVGMGAFGGEPDRDVRLGHVLRDYLGTPPHHEVDWNALMDRISARVVAPAASWWDYAARWHRRTVPIALAAGIAGAMLLWNTSAASANTESPDLLAAMVRGDSADVAVRLFARSIASTAVDLTREVPE